MTRPVRNKLFDLEFDEVSAVDRPANQLGLIAFAKNESGEGPNQQEDSMPEIEVFDSDGLAVDGESLEHGDIVYDESGNEYVFVEEDDDEATDEVDDEITDESDDEVYDESEDEAGDYVDEDADQYAGVGKGLPGLGRAAFMSGMKTNAQAGRAGFAGLRQGVRRAPAAVGTDAYGRANRFGNKAWGARSNVQRAGIATAASTPFVAGGVMAGDGKVRAQKSLGDEVLEGLSKAVNDDERNQLIAKALDEVEVYKAQNEAMATELEDMREQQIEEVFIAKAAEYNLPVSPGVLGPILKSMAEVLTDEQLDVVDQLFASVGDALYDEIGYVGDTDNISVLDQVNAYASELVGKAEGLTPEQAQVFAFESNPAAYEAYLHEIGR